MNKNAENHDIYAQKDTQTIAQKSKILKSAFAVHSRHVSEGFIQEILYSKPDPKDFNTFAEMIDELELELVELENNEQTNSLGLENKICFFEGKPRFQHRSHMPPGPSHELKTNEGTIPSF